jgi:hypothetical protein
MRPLAPGWADSSLAKISGAGPISEPIPQLAGGAVEAAWPNEILRDFYVMTTKHELGFGFTG